MDTLYFKYFSSSDFIGVSVRKNNRMTGMHNIIRHCILLSKTINVSVVPQRGFIGKKTSFLVFLFFVFILENILFQALFLFNK